MSDRTERFQVAGMPIVQLRVPVGSVRFADGPEGEVVVRLHGSESTLSRYRIEQTGDLIEIGPEPGPRIGLAGVDVVVESGTAPEIRARLASADVSAVREVTDLQVDAASGDVRADRITGSATVRSASGDVRFGSVDGFLKVSIASGDVLAGVAKGGVDVKSASGDVRIKIAEGGVKVKTASGDVSVGTLRSGDFDAKSLSGGVALGIPPGRVLEVSLDTATGKVSTDFTVEAGDGVSTGPGEGVSIVKVRSVSGDISLRPAETA